MSRAGGPVADGPAGADATAARLGDRALDPEARLERARSLAWRVLDRRDRTVAELRAALTRRGVEPEAVATVVAELATLGYLDDGRYARRFAEDRRHLDGWGSDRIERRLAALGVDAELIAAAVGDRDRGEELAAAAALLERRVAPPTTPRERDRALGILLRRGYAPELAYDAVRRHAGGATDED